MLAQWDDNDDGRITCAEARAHGIAPVRRDHPTYAYLRDGDGIVCEAGGGAAKGGTARSRAGTRGSSALRQYGGGWTSGGAVRLERPGSALQGARGWEPVAVSSSESVSGRRCFFSISDRSRLSVRWPASRHSLSNEKKNRS